MKPVVLLGAVSCCLVQFWLREGVLGGVYSLVSFAACEVFFFFLSLGRCRDVQEQLLLFLEPG